MSLLDIDLDNVPDVLPVPPQKITRFRIEKAGEVKPQKEDTSKNTLHQQILLDEDGEFKGFELMDWIGLNSEQGKVRLKRLMKAIGLEPVSGQPININHFVGRSGYCHVGHQTQNEGGRQTTRARVGDYLIPGDQGLPKS